MDTLIKDEQSAPVELMYKRPASGLVAPELMVMWCLRPEAREYLDQKQVANAHLLLVTVKDGAEQNRYLKPLTDGACYVGFDHLGVNELRAQVVWPMPDESVDKFCGRIMEPASSGGGFEMNLLGQPKWAEDLDEVVEPGPRRATWKGPAGDQPVVILGVPEKAPGDEERHYYKVEGSDTRIPADEVEFLFGFRDFTSINRLEGEVVEAFDIDPELFAKPPRERTKRFVGYFPWGRGRAEDQCDMRGKIIMSLLAAPFVGLFWVLLRAPVGILGWLGLTILGIPNVKLRPVFHPVNMQFRDIWQHSDDRSRWYIKENGEDTFPLFWGLNPATVTVVGLGLSVANLIDPFWSWWMVAVVAVVGPPVGLLVIFLAFALYDAIPGLAGLVGQAVSPLTRRKQSRRKNERKRLAREKAATKEQERLDQLACTEKPRDPAILNATGGVRTVVRLGATKAKTGVCKRYAKS